MPCSIPDFQTQPGVLVITGALGSKLRMRVSNTSARGNMADAGQCKILEIQTFFPLKKAFLVSLCL